MNRLVEGVLSLFFLALGAYFIIDYACNDLYKDVDFNLRYNEVLAVVSGRDPFLIWKGVIPPDGFVPYSHAMLPQWHSLPLVHAYSPWVYVFMMPFVLLSQNVAAEAYRILGFIALLGSLAGAVVMLFRRTGVCWVGCLAFAEMCAAASDGFVRCLVVGNFGVIVTGAAFLAIWLHEHGRDGWAGLLWSVVAVKPQLGGLFLLVLVLERKWRTLFTTGLILAVATLISAILCGRSPVAMVLSVAECGISQFPGTGLIPAEQYYQLSKVFGERAILSSNAIVGILLCCLFWWMLRKNGSVWVRFMPAMVLSLTWATFRLHDFSIQLLPAFTAVLAVVVARRWPVAVAAALLVIALIVRGLAFYEGPFIVPANVFVIVVTYVFARSLSDTQSTDGHHMEGR